MDKISIISSLRQIADTLDNNSLYNQAEKLTDLMVKIAQNDNDIKPDTADIIDLIIDGKSVRVPKGIESTKIFDKELYKLNFDPENEQLFYKSENGKKIVFLDKDGKVRETRPKRYDLTKQLGLRKMFGNWRLPNLNKSIPLEPYLRKELIPDVARVVRPIGDVAKQTITKPITDTLGAATDDLGISVPNRVKPFMADAKFDLGSSSDPTPITLKPSEDSVEIKAPLNLPDPTGPKAVIPEDSKKNDDSRVIKISKDQLQHIQSPDDLLFWSMMVGNSYPYSEYNKDNEKEYYSSDNKSNTLNYINKLTSSPWVEKINPQIKKYKAEAIEKLNRKTAGKNMNRQILASMNEICDELETLGMNKAASEMTEIMVKLAQNKKVTVCLIDGKPAVKIEGRKRPIFGPASGPFTSASHARSYAGKITPNFIDEIPANMMPGRSWRNQGPTGKPWTRDDQEMHDFEASREDKF